MLRIKPQIHNVVWSSKEKREGFNPSRKWGCIRIWIWWHWGIPDRVPEARRKPKQLQLERSSFFPTCLASWPWPRVASSILHSSVLPLQTLTSLWKFKQKTSLQKWFSSCGHATFWTKKISLMNCLPQWFFLVSHVALPCAWFLHPGMWPYDTCLHPTHTHTHTSLEQSPQEIRDIGFCLCVMPNRSKNCLLLLINSVSLQQESMLFLCFSHTHTHIHPLPEMFWLFSTWSIGGYPPQESCSSCLHLAGIGNSGKAIFWKSHWRGQHKAWLQSPREKTSEPDEVSWSPPIPSCHQLDLSQGPLTC